eukprot:TRINITY_DN17615_c0_g1_i5.p2 TRINITY_DN17615_c0_g1~~TRINITY_DN17615_c0_g1_i5.p2  ORF type:complete len:228 (+),score=67.74 TRINITY_DN17615_c0_g1_i5:1018-1701(+)
MTAYDTTKKARKKQGNEDADEDMQEEAPGPALGQRADDEKKEEDDSEASKVKPVTKAAAKRPLKPQPKAMRPMKKDEKEQAATAARPPPPRPSRRAEPMEESQNMEKDRPGMRLRPRPPSCPPPKTMKTSPWQTEADDDDRTQRVPPWRRMRQEAADTPAGQNTGMIKELKENGYGFIRPVDENRDLYFHSAFCITEFEALRLGDWVAFKTRRDDSGRRVAKGVRRQ